MLIIMIHRIIIFLYRNANRIGIYDRKLKPLNREDIIIAQKDVFPVFIKASC